MYCRNCGTENKEGASFCKSCGEVLEENAIQRAVTPENNPPMKKKGNQKFWIGLSTLVVIAAVILALIPITKDVKAKSDYKTFIEEGQKYLEELDYDKAEAAYLQAIAIEPKKKKPYIELADIYVAQEEYGEAVDILVQAQEAGAEEDASDDTSIEDKIDEIKEIEQAAVEEEEEPENYSWTVEPVIEADDIYYLNDNDAQKNAVNVMHKQMEEEDNYAVVRKGNSYGLITMDGELLDEMNFIAVTTHCGVYEVEYPTAREMAEGYIEDTTFQCSDGAFWPPFGYGDIEGLEGGIYYWKNGIQKGVSVSENGMPDPRQAIPIQKGDSTDGSLEKVQLAGKYGIYYDGELAEDFIYDECGSYSEGLLAVCRGGKWGYVNEKGEVIIPLEYDASWNAYVPFENRESKEAVDYCYAASEGTVVLCKDEEWELCDVDGKQLIRPGIFEKICPMRDGKLWVKKDGKWGVIELKEEGDAEPEEENEEKEASIFKSIPSKYTFSSGAGAWWTSIEIKEDGSFVGQYSDTNIGETGENHPNGTVYICNFNGRFSEPEQIDEYTYSMKLDFIEQEGTPKEAYYEDGVKYVYSTPYGFDDADEFLLFLPGAKISDLPEGLMPWLNLWGEEAGSETLPRHSIYNVGGEEGFIAADAYN